MFRKQSTKKTNLYIKITSVQSTKSSSGSYVIAIERPRQYRESDKFKFVAGNPVAFPDTFQLQATFFEQENGWRVKKLTIKLIRIITKSKSKVEAKWVQNISTLYDTEQIAFMLQQKTKELGNISISLTISKFFGKPKEELQPSQSTPAITDTVTSLHEISRSESESNIDMQILEFFDNFEPEKVDGYPVLAQKVIKMIPVTSPLIVPEIFDAFGNCMASLGEKPLVHQIYGLITCLCILHFLIKRQMTQTQQFVLIREYFKTLIEISIQHIIQDFGQAFEETEDLDQTCIEVCNWIQTIGSGKFCQIVFSCLLCGFALSFTPELVPVVCSNFCVREVELQKVVAYYSQGQVYELGDLSIELENIMIAKVQKL